MTDEHYLWQVIKNHPNSLKLYEQKLLGTGEVMKEDVQRIHVKVNRILNEEFAKSKDHVPNKRDWL
jgi:2-oxoglutarate dehydrogenase E1 component